VQEADGRIVSVNVGHVREFDYYGQRATSAIWKSPVNGRVQARGTSLGDDEQADRVSHGGVDKAIYAYAIEDTRWWDRGFGRGTFGENLTTEGIDLTQVLLGERWGVGTTVLEVSEPRIPCWKLDVAVEDEAFLRAFTVAQRCGTYLRIIEEGELGAGDGIRVIERPQHDVTVRDVFRIYTKDRDEAERLLAVPGLSGAWRGWAEDTLARRRAR